MNMMYYYGNGFYPEHMWGLGSLFSVLFWIFFIVLIIAIIKRVKHGGYGWRMDNSINIIKERYAKGEITKEQFELMKKDLM